MWFFFQRGERQEGVSRPSAAADRRIGRELPQLRPARRGGSWREEKMCQELVLVDPVSTF
jgi:hypothetical protein